MKIFFLFQMWN